MKKTLAFLVFASLLFSWALPAGAEIVGWAGNDAWIHRYLAPNGQELFFLSMEQEPPVAFEDVNGDGTEDIVVVTSIGASNYYAEFFIWDGEKYVMARHEGEALANYEIAPGGYVLSHGKNGWAGALFEDWLYTWEGTNLRLLRKMVSQQEERTEFGNNSYTVSWSEDTLRVSLTACVHTESEWEDTLLWEARYQLTDLDDPAVFTEMKARLWEGLER